jgi:hypothetical protein
MSEGLEEDLERLLPRRWKNRWQRLSTRTKTTYKIGVVIAGFVGALSGAYAYVALDVTVTPGVIGSETNPLSAEFLIKNAGHLSLIENEIECDILTSNGRIKTSANMVLTPGRKMAQRIDELAPGATATRNCGGAAIGGLSFPATFIISVKSAWPKLWPILPWTSKEGFVSVRDSSGHIQIVPDTP